MMGLETGTYIDSLVVTNPLGSDAKNAGDDHLRLIKSTIKATFPNIAGAVTPTHTELNFVDGVTSNIQTQLDGKQASGSYQAQDATLTALAGLVLSQGDVIYATGPDAVARLPKGTASQVLAMNAGATAPEWKDNAASGVTSVTGTSPVVSSGGATPAISMPAANAGAAGHMSAAYASKLDGIQAGANYFVGVATDQGHNNVGSLCFAAEVSGSFGGFLAGSTYAGSGLRASGVVEDGVTSLTQGAALSGTWRALGTAAASGSSAQATLFQRIA